MLLEKRIPIKYLLGKIKFELVIVTIYALAVQFLEERFTLTDFSVPIALPALLGTAISLILAFRIGQSYDRWWEGRKIWGAIVNDSRTLARQVLTLVSSTAVSRKAKETMIYRQIAWCYALGEALRGYDPHKDMENYLTEEEQAFIETHSNVPNALLLLHSEDIARWKSEGAVNDFQEIQMDSTVSRLTDWMGMSERIKNTIFPKQYSLLVEFLLYLFVVLLPFGIVEYFHALEGVITIIISLPFFMLEKTALHLQNPFDDKPTDVAVTDIAQTIEMNLKQMFNEQFEKEPAKDSYYVM